MKLLYIGNIYKVCHVLESAFILESGSFDIMYGREMTSKQPYELGMLIESTKKTPPGDEASSDTSGAYT
jgi:hypothetical protein